MGDYVVDPYPHAKFHQDTITPFCPQICENAPRVTRLVFWFFCQLTAKTPAPIFTINTSNDVVSRKDVPFGGPESKILGQFSTGLRKFCAKKALTMGMFWSKLPLIVIVAQ